MKTTALLLIITSTLLVGCAENRVTGADQLAKAVEPASVQPLVWWDPLTYHWAVLWPGNWFTRQLKVNDQGVGAINRQTAMQYAPLSEALGDRYHLRQVMSIQQGNQAQVTTSWQAVVEDKVRLIIRGEKTVSQIEVSLPEAVGPDGVKIGSTFSELYSKAFGVCQPKAFSKDVVCASPTSKHVQYVYTGESHTPEGIMPPDTLLKHWQLQTLIWHK